MKSAFPTIYRNQPDAGGGAPAPDAAAAPASPDPAAPAAGGQAPEPASAPSAYRPEGLPDHFYGKSDKDTIDNLYKAVDGFRRSQSERGEVPKDASGYVFEPADPVKPYAEALANDPFFEKVKASALAHQIPAKQFNGFLNAIMSEMIAGEMVGEPFSADKERAALAPDIADPAERAKKADAIVRENIALVDSWKAQGLPEGSAQWLASQLDRAAANQTLAWIQSRLGETPPALGGAAATGASTKAQLDAMMADPRGKVGSPSYDPAFVRQRDEAFRANYGA